MLKVALIEEERRGAELMEVWGGEGAAPVFARDGGALLMERSVGGKSLAAMSVSGGDDDATRIICSVANRLHACKAISPSSLVPLSRWFRALDTAAAARGGIFAECAKIATDLLADPMDIATLHGDIHHDNILDFGLRGWLAIDPKALVGERTFDFANLFCNPDARAADGARFDRRAGIVCQAAGIDRTRLLKWVFAWSGLSAAFSIEDGEPHDAALAIAQLIKERLL